MTCEKARHVVSEVLGEVKNESAMASKAYVASMTVTELKQELKQRGLSTRGSKKNLRDRLERAFDEEELDDSSSESERGQLGPAEAGFNFSVPAESFLPADQIREDSPVLSPNGEKMIISVELSNKKTLEVYSPKPPAYQDEGGGGEGEGGGPLVVAVTLPDDATVMDVERGSENHNSVSAVTATERMGDKYGNPPSHTTEDTGQHGVPVCDIQSNVNNQTPSTTTGGAEEVTYPLPVQEQASDRVPHKEMVRSEEGCGERSRDEGDGSSVGVGEAEEEEGREAAVDGVSGVVVEEGTSGTEKIVSDADSQPPGEEMAVKKMEVDSSEPLQNAEAGHPESTTDKEETSASQVTSTEQSQTPEEREDGASLVDTQLPSHAPDQACGPEVVQQAEKGDMEEWVIIEKPMPDTQSEGTVVVKEASGRIEEPAPSTAVQPEMSAGAQEMSQEEEETVKQSSDIQKNDVERNDKMEVEGEMSQGNEKTAPSVQQPQQEEKDSDKVAEPSHDATAAVMQIESKSPPATNGDSSAAVTAPEEDGQLTEEQAPANISAPPHLPPPGPPGTKPNSGTSTTPVPSEPSTATVAEEVSEGVSMEVAVLVHAEEDDLSVFSTEAAEAQKITSTREKAQDKAAREKVRDRERDKDRSKHRRPSGSPASSLALMSKQSAHVEEGTGSSASGRSSSEAAGMPPVRSSPVGETKHDGGGTESQSEPPSKKRRRISAHVSSSTSTAEPASIQWGGGGGGGEKRRRWGSGKQRAASSTTNISSDVLKDIIPGELEVVEGEDVMEGEGGGEEGVLGEEKTVGDDKVREKIDNKAKDEHQLEWEEKVREREAKQRESERARQELETRQRIEARIRARQEQAEAKAKRDEKVDSGKHRSPSPALNPPSNILHVQHMTRPFTLAQLRQLLAEDGPQLKDGFWTNNIKSHCIAVYASKEVAVTTRRRLHGLKWPSTNPKLLVVDFLSPKQVQKISEGDLMVVEAPPITVTKEKEEGKEGEGVTEVGEKVERGESVREEGGEKMEVGGDEGETQEESAELQMLEKTEAKKDEPKSAEVSTADSSKAAPADVVNPDLAPTAPPAPEKSSQATQLLDDLFRKTKATPSVYWLPLSEAEVQQKQQEREAREAEREKRRQERQKTYEEERKREREREREREEASRKERERRIQEERDRRARERVRRRSSEHYRSRSRSRSRSGSRDRYRDRDHRRR